MSILDALQTIAALGALAFAASIYKSVNNIEIDVSRIKRIMRGRENGIEPDIIDLEEGTGYRDA